MKTVFLFRNFKWWSY